MTSSSARRAYAGPPLFSFGFRPFFLLACAWPAATIPVWVGTYLGCPPFEGLLTRDWHVHEMIFGYLSAVMAGFLLTAVPNWTGRLPVMGAPLAGLAGLWLAGRLAMLLFPAEPLSAAVDVAFLFVFAAVVWREVLAGRNWKNLPVCGLVTLMALANLAVDLRPLSAELAAGGERLALGVAAVMIALIGGRVTPSFTRNWLAPRGETRLPAPASLFDTAVLVATAVAAAAWVAVPEARPVGALLVLAGVANLVRLARWRGHRTLAEPLVWVMHAGYGWMALSLAILGASVLAPEHIARSAGIHALTAGAIGVMTLAMMTRATLGHTGRARHAGPWTTLIYVSANLAAALRVAAALAPEDAPILLSLASLAWSVAFAGFVLVYGPMLWGPRADAAPARPQAARA